MPTTRAGDAGIAYTDTGGDGPAIALVHGFPFSSSMWEPQIEALKDQFRVIAPDLKGFGSSDAPDDPSAYSMGSYADELATVLRDASVDRAVLCGLSMGGYICFELWRRQRAAVDALILADTRAEADPPEGVEKRTSQQGQVAAEGIGGIVDALSSGPLLSETTRADKPDVVARARALMDQPAAGYIGALEAMKTRPDSSGDLSSIDVPCLVIVGEQDTLTPPEVARNLHENIGGSELVVIPEAGHLSNIESPQAFNAAMLEFLGRLQPR
jgi:3-oxoadipate enol-lactonase